MDLLNDFPYYSHCFGKITIRKPKPITIWRQIKGVRGVPLFDDNGNNIITDKVSLSAINQHGGTESYSVDIKTDVEFPVLKSQYIFDGKNAWYLCRRPVREKYRGLHIENTELISPLAMVLRRDFQDQLRLLLSREDRQRVMLESLNYKVRFVPFAYALRQILSRGALSVPFAPQWAISLAHIKGYDITVFRRTLPVGLLNTTNNKMVAIQPLYRQELQDQFPHAHIA